jgi:hypothetical protein
MAKYAGFVSGAYEARSWAVSADKLVNWFPEIVESKLGKSTVNYYPTPGLILHCDPSKYGAGRAAFALDGRMWAVIGDSLVEFKADGTFTRYPGLKNDITPAFIVANAKTPTQLMIAASDFGYIFDTGAMTLVPITGGIDPVTGSAGVFNGCRMPFFLDDYLGALTPDSRIIQISQLGDGLTWSGIDFSANLGSADNVLAVITDHEYLYQAGSKRIAVYANTGAATFPIQPVPGAFIEQGIDAIASFLRVDNTLMWLGAGEHGSRVVYRAEGFIPKRVSTHAVEARWRKYPRTDDAVAMSDVVEGHTNYRITFPTADETWCYDLVTGLWHERASFDSATGTLHAQTQRYHCTWAGVHYVVGIDGKIYREDPDTYTEDGRPIKRIRVGPVVANENKLMFVTRLEIVIQPGIGLDGDPAAPGGTPTLVLRYSGDSGQNWSNEMYATGGQHGDTLARVVFDQLGSGRAWVPELSTTDPNNWVIVTANIEATAGAW